MLVISLSKLNCALKASSDTTCLLFPNQQHDESARGYLWIILHLLEYTAIDSFHFFLIFFSTSISRLQSSHLSEGIHMHAGYFHWVWFLSSYPESPERLSQYKQKKCNNQHSFLKRHYALVFKLNFSWESEQHTALQEDRKQRRAEDNDQQKAVWRLV